MKRDDGSFKELLGKLEREQGFQGTLYRQACLRRRIAVRMRACGVSGPDQYSRLLDSDPDEYKSLVRVLTINVSKFFRNPETWSVIRSRVLPELLSKAGPPLVWSAGSAAGEEAYSVAILAWQWREERADGRWEGVRIIGTDIDEASLESARAGTYSDAALSETPAEIRERWFETGESNRLKEPIRSLVEFKRLDILTDRPSFSADLILCRNLLIYLDRRAQRRVFKTFVEVLRPGGYLVLGRVEMLTRRLRSMFETIDARERVYRKL